jgi:hypothetical protein
MFKSPHWLFGFTAVILILPSRKPEAKQKKFLSESQAVNKAQAFIAPIMESIKGIIYITKKRYKPFIMVWH